MKRLLFIVLLTVLAAIVVWPQKPGNYIPGGDALPGNPGLHLGNFIRQGAKLGLAVTDEIAERRVHRRDVPVEARERHARLCLLEKNPKAGLRLALRCFRATCSFHSTWRCSGGTPSTRPSV